MSQRCGDSLTERFNENGSGLMNNPRQDRNWILGIHGPVAGAALTFVILLGLTILATRSAQAQTYSESALYSFCSAPSCNDGAYPLYGTLVRDTQGNLYGTTADGGTAGVGTVFKVDATGKETVLYSFTGTGGTAQHPTLVSCWTRRAICMALLSVAGIQRASMSQAFMAVARCSK